MERIQLIQKIRRMKKVNNIDHRIHQLPQQALQIPGAKHPNNQVNRASFKDLLTSELGLKELKVSKHATERLQERNIHIDKHQWQVIESKMAEAKQKGITDSLVVLDNAALLISTKNNTVVTAMDRKEATSRIFTNINGTILIEK